MTNRCAWSTGNQLMIDYHDHDWGVPIHDDTRIFEYMVLDAFQAGLSWLTILKKRENFRKAFDSYDVKKISAYGEKDFNRLMNDAGIIRNRLKITATIENAKQYQKVQQEFGNFDTYIWRFTEGKTVQNKWKSINEIPPKTELSDCISKDLLKRGFKFVGSTIIYAFLQAMGIVNDHTTDCFRYNELVGMAKI
jgi:DNA-3-methyladenine glycosylase I